MDSGGGGGLPLALNEGDDSPIREEQIREILATLDDTYEAWLHEPWTEKDEYMFALGCLQMADVLEPLMAQGRWMDVAGYVERAFRFHVTRALEVGSAVPTDGRIWEIQRSHPELYMLPRVQRAMELASLGLVEDAAEHHLHLLQVVEWAGQRSSPRHTQFLRDMVEPLGSAVNNGAPYILPLELVMGERADRTRRAIRDYLHVYLPEPSGRLQQMEGVADDCGDLNFADKLPTGAEARRARYWCLVCHTEVVGDLWHVRRHLRELCRASTASVRNRLKALPDSKKRKRHNDGGNDPGAGTSGGAGGSGPSGGGGAAPPGAGAVVIIGAA